MPLVVKLSERLSDDFLRMKTGDGLTSAEAARALESTLVSFGKVLTPAHSTSADPTLSTYFEVSEDDRAMAERIAHVLREMDGVEAAYWKPATEAP